MMKIMNAVLKRDILTTPNYWNISYNRDNQILSKRKLARFIASLICQTHEIEHKLENIAKRKYISMEEQKSIEESCELYEQMLALIKVWKNLHFQNLEDGEFIDYVNPWSLQIYNEICNEDANLSV